MAVASHFESKREFQLNALCEGEIWLAYDTDYDRLAKYRTV